MQTRILMSHWFCGDFCNLKNEEYYQKNPKCSSQGWGQFKNGCCETMITVFQVGPEIPSELQHCTAVIISAVGNGTSECQCHGTMFTLISFLSPNLILSREYHDLHVWHHWYRSMCSLHFSQQCPMAALFASFKNSAKQCSLEELLAAEIHLDLVVLYIVPYLNCALLLCYCLGKCFYCNSEVVISLKKIWSTNC